MTLTVLKKSLFIIAAVLVTLPAAYAQGAKGIVYKIPEAGVQLEVPPGWAASKDATGNHVIAKKDGDGYVVLYMSVVPREASMTMDVLYAAFSEGIFEGTRKDWKGFKVGELMKETQNGMAVRAQRMDGTDADRGGDVEGLVMLFDSPKPLGVFGGGTKKRSDAMGNETSAILASIKKIQ